MSGFDDIPAPGDQVVATLVDDEPRRQCGRCRTVFVLDDQTDAPSVSDWWICEPCRVLLIPNWRR
jgi:hypothetical protein